MSHHPPWTGYLLAAIGVGVLLFEIGLHFYGYFTGVAYQLNQPVLYVGMVIGFVGFYMINPKSAEGGTDILTRTAVALISVVRTGNRAGDVKVEVTPVAKGAVVTVPQPVGAPHPDTDPAIVTAIGGGVDGAVAAANDADARKP